MEISPPRWECVELTGWVGERARGWAKQPGRAAASGTCTKGRLGGTHTRTLASPIVRGELAEGGPVPGLGGEGVIKAGTPPSVLAAAVGV